MTFKSTLTIAAVLASAVCFGQGGTPFDALKGKPAPAFSMTDLHGKVLNNHNLLGKVVVLDFWATWCGPCKKASPVMQKLHQKYGKRGLVVIGAETMETTDPMGAKAYSKEHGYTYTFTTKNDKLTTSLGVQGIPAFVIIGKDGKIVRTQIGIYANINELFTSFEKTIKPLL